MCCSQWFYLRSRWMRRGSEETGRGALEEAVGTVLPCPVVPLPEKQAERLLVRVLVGELGSRMGAISVAFTTDFTVGAMDPAIITDTDMAACCSGTVTDSRITPLRITALRRTGMEFLCPMTHMVTTFLSIHPAGLRLLHFT